MRQSVSRLSILILMTDSLAHTLIFNVITSIPPVSLSTTRNSKLILFALLEHFSVILENLGNCFLSAFVLKKGNFWLRKRETIQLPCNNAMDIQHWLARGSKIFFHLTFHLRRNGKTFAM